MKNLENCKIGDNGARITRTQIIGGLALTLALTMVVSIVTGCGKNARLADHDVKDVKVGDVPTAYGKTLDKSSTVRDVVYVLFKAIVDDYDGETKAQRETAFDTQLKICAPTAIKELAAAGRNLSEQEQIEAMYNAVRHWAPILGFYRDNFRADYETLTKKMYLTTAEEKDSGTMMASVHIELEHPDPENNPNASAVANIRLVQEEGYWRVCWVGWEHTTRHWPRKTASKVKKFTKPKPSPSPEPESKRKVKPAPTPKT